MAVSTKRTRPRQRQASTSSSPPPPSKAAKKAKGSTAASSSKFSHIFDPPSATGPPSTAAALPARTHPPSYHRPLLLLPIHESGIHSLLSWFASVSLKRDMPWRSAYLDPSTYDSPAELREVRKKRAYQVWISEIMLQQTRVEIVKSYWLNWMSKWPTIDHLASAPEEQVLAAWRGLGYYSRATRIHTAAKKVVSDPTMDGLLPEHPAELEKNVPGVGHYTAGAIASIVFGQPVPILDGNVARVLSRQLGLYANPKAKITTDLLWAAADVLVKKAFEVGEEKGKVPGEWNQALMELGSTVCTPQKPDCGGCPIRDSCRAYAEAEGSMKKEEKEVGIVDMEDMCGLCEPFPFEDESEISKATEEDEVQQKGGLKKMRQATLSFAFSPPASATSKAKAKSEPDTSKVAEAIKRHIQKFPMKLEKKKIRQEECLVCIIHRRGQAEEWLLEQRPNSGLLASMWQFPALTLSTTAAATVDDKKQDLFPSTPLPKLMDSFVDSLVDGKTTRKSKKEKVGSLTHIFSHLHLTMHVYSVELSSDTAMETDGDTKAKQSKQRKQGAEEEDAVNGAKNKNFGSKLGDKAPRRWASAQEVEAETMGTGMRNCWLALQTQQPSSLTKTARASAKKSKT